MVVQKIPPKLLLHWGSKRDAITSILSILGNAGFVGLTFLRSVKLVQDCGHWVLV